MSSRTEIAAEETTSVGTRVAAAGGILGALAMTSCCILPLLLFSLGATGAWIGRMGALYQYKWFFFAFAGLSLGYGFFKAYWRTPATCVGESCARPINQRLVKRSLWIATFVVMASLLFPYIAPYFIGY